MPIETEGAFLSQDSLAIVANKLNSKLKQGKAQNLVCYHRDRIKLKIRYATEDALRRGGHNTQSIGLKEGRMEKQIACGFENK